MLADFSWEPKSVLLLVLALIAMAFILAWAFYLVRHARERVSTEPGTEVKAPGIAQLAIGFVTDFLDTLSIGSFATTTALFKFLRQVPDRVIPGTLNVGHALPTALQAFIYISAIHVDPTTLIAMIAASVLGSWMGAGLVAGLPRRKVQLGMGAALLVAGIVLLVRTIAEHYSAELGLRLEPRAPTSELTGGLLVAGVVGNFVLGVLMMIGVGLYAPCLVLVQVLGMGSDAAFPIMMGSCAFLMPTAGLQFIRKSSYSPRAALGLTLGGLPAVAIAATIVYKLPLKYLNWLVLGVILYTAVTMILAARQREPAVVGSVSA